MSTATKGQALLPWNGREERSVVENLVRDSRGYIRGTCAVSPLFIDDVGCARYRIDFRQLINHNYNAIFDPASEITTSFYARIKWAAGNDQAWEPSIIELRQDLPRAKKAGWANR